MAPQSQHQIIPMNTATVIPHPDQPGATAFDLDTDLSRAGIQTVFQHFLDHGSGPFNDLTGSDLVGELRW